MDREAYIDAESEAPVETPFTGVTPTEDVRPATDRHVGAVVINIDARPLRSALSAALQNGVREAARRIEARAAELYVNDQPIGRVTSFERFDAANVLVPIPAGSVAARLYGMVEEERAAEVEAERIRARYSRELDAEEVTAIRWREWREALGVSADCPIGNIDLCASHRSDAADALAMAMQAFGVNAAALVEHFARNIGGAFVTGYDLGTVDGPRPANRRERRALAAGAKIEDGRIVLRRGRSKKGRDRE